MTVDELFEVLDEIWHRRRHHHRVITPVLSFNAFAVHLIPKETIAMATSLHIDNLGNLSISFVDSAGNPVSPAPTPDAPPVWAISDTSVATLVPAADGLSAVLTPVLISGTATITLSLALTGVAFTATMAVTVVAGAVASIAIVLTPVPKA